MIKKYITLAALLSAGTALANAANYTIETTFKYRNNAGIPVFDATSTITSPNNSSWSYPSNETIGTTAGLNPGNFRTTGTVGDYARNTANSFIPVDIDLKSGSWSINLSYSDLSDYIHSPLNQMLGQGIKVDKVELLLGTFTSTGKWLSGYHSQNFDVVVGFGSGAKQTFGGQIVEGYGYQQASGSGFTGYGTGPSQTPLTLTIRENDVAFKFADTAGVPENLTLTFKGNGNTTDSRVGLQKVKLHLSNYNISEETNPEGPPVPEPSAFGLLAGLGALALVASRRRRK